MLGADFSEPWDPELEHGDTRSYAGVVVRVGGDSARGDGRFLKHYNLICHFIRWVRTLESLLRQRLE